MKFKCILNTFQAMDCKTMEQMFQNLSQKGWILKHYGKAFLLFQACTPKKRIFHIETFFETNQLEQDYIDFCEEQGWKLSFHNEQIRIFYNEQDALVHQLQTSDEIIYEQIQSTSCVQSTSWFFIITYLTLQILLYNLVLRSTIQMNDWFVPFMLSFLSIWFLTLYRMTRFQQWKKQTKIEMNTTQTFRFPPLKQWKHIHQITRFLIIANIMVYLLTFLMIPYKTIMLSDLLYQITPCIITMGIGLILVHVFMKKIWLSMILCLLLSAITIPLHTLSFFQHYPTSLVFNHVTKLADIKDTLKLDHYTLTYQSRRILPLHVTLYMYDKQAQTADITIQYDEYKTIDDAIENFSTIATTNHLLGNFDTRVYGNNNELLYGYGLNEASEWNVDEYVFQNSELLLRKDNILYHMTFSSLQDEAETLPFTTYLVNLQAIFRSE